MDDRVDYDSDRTTPPNVGQDLERLGEAIDASREELEGLMDQYLDAMERDLAENPLTGMSAIPIPGDEQQTVGLYVADAGDYHEIGITFEDEFYRPWVGKWRSSGEGEVYYPVDIADGGFPQYRLDPEAWPEDAPDSHPGEGWDTVRPLNEQEREAVKTYLERKQEIVDTFIDDAPDDPDELVDRLGDARDDLSDAFDHLR